MRPEEIRAHLRSQPFRPFRVFLSDGSHYDVVHPDFMLIGKREVVIGLDPSDGHFPERNAYIDPVHITCIEPINGSNPRSRKGTRRK